MTDGVKDHTGATLQEMQQRVASARLAMGGAQDPAGLAAAQQHLDQMQADLDMFGAPDDLGMTIDELRGKVVALQNEIKNNFDANIPMGDLKERLVQAEADLKAAQVAIATNSVKF